MPLTCTICRHQKRSAIERTILTGEGLRTVADVSDQARALLEQPDAPEPLFQVVL